MIFQINFVCYTSYSWLLLFIVSITIVYSIAVKCLSLQEVDRATHSSNEHEIHEHSHNTTGKLIELYMSCIIYYNIFYSVFFLLFLASDEPNYQNLLPYFEHISDWKKLGVYLLPDEYASRINDIDETHNGNISRCRWALIREYLKVGQVSWKTVINALERSGHPNIVKKIKKDHCGVFCVEPTNEIRHLSKDTTGNFYWFIKQIRSNKYICT